MSLRLENKNARFLALCSRNDILCARNDILRARNDIGSARNDMMKKTLAFLMSFLLMTESLYAKPKPHSIASLDQAVENFLRGKELYYELSFDQAVSHLKKAQKIYYENISHLTKGDELHESHLFTALCYFSQNKVDLSKEEIRKAYLLNPKRRLDTKLYPPPFIEHANKTFQGFKDLKRLRLEINSTPPFAVVFINGFQMGLTPLMLKDFPVSEHHIKIVLDDFKEWDATLPGQERELHKINAKLLPLSDPSWVTKRITKAPLSYTPANTLSDQTQKLLSELEKDSESSWNKSIILYGLLAVATGAIGYGFLREKDKAREAKEAKTQPVPRITVHFP